MLEKPFKANKQKLMLLACSSAHHKVVVELSGAVDDGVCVSLLRASGA